MSPRTQLHAELWAAVGALKLEAQVNTGSGTLVLVGPNAAGKTSLLKLLLGALSAEHGYIAIGEDILLDTRRKIHVPLEQRRIGYVPQDYALFPHLTARANVQFALDNAPLPLTPKARREKTDSLLERLGLTAQAERRPQALSGGEKQRVALARALAAEPRALLLDEPLAALDVNTRTDVRSYLNETLQQLDLPCIVATHDSRDAKELGQCVAVLESGRITQHGTWHALSAAPATPFVAAFVSR